MLSRQVLILSETMKLGGLNSPPLEGHCRVVPSWMVGAVVPSCVNYVIFLDKPLGFSYSAFLHLHVGV